jgi:hypothetical protein
MAFVTQVIEDSHRNYVIKVVGTPVDTAALLVDVSALAIPCAAVKLWEVSYDVGAASSVQLLWDATSDAALLTLSEGPGQTLCFRDIGGINNNAGAGKTGDVLITSAGTAQYNMVLWFVKKSPVIPL